MIKVLIVDDSLVMRTLLAQILSADPEIQVIGTADNGEKAITAVKTLKPDIVSMDIHMPVMDGIEATRRIMQECPVPIVVVTSTGSYQEIETNFRTLEAGALALIDKPSGSSDPAVFIKMIKLMSEIKVVRRKSTTSSEKKLSPIAPKSLQRDIQLIAIGASTGGPPILQSILQRLPKHFPPILIVQHITPGFTNGLVEWLQQTTGVNVKLAEDRQLALSNHVYLAPDHFNLGVDPEKKIILETCDPHDSLCPSVAHLFRSVAFSMHEKALGILLSGMGRDGARELELMKNAGAVTVAQDKESSVVHGMPGEAIAMGAADYILSPAQLSEFILTLLNAG